FQSGTGVGPGGGLMYEFPDPPHFGLQLRLGYWDRSGLLTRDEPQFVNVGGHGVDGTFRHSIDATLPTLYFEVLPFLLPTEHLRIFLGPQVGYALSGSFKQREEILSPAEGTFE